MPSLNMIILRVARIFHKNKTQKICTYTDCSSVSSTFGFIEKFRKYKQNLVPCSELRVNCFSFDTNSIACILHPRLFLQCLAHQAAQS